MVDYSATIRNTFDFGSVRDAQILFEHTIRNAFPAYDFRRLELIRFVREDKFMEGRSWNHVFQIRSTTCKNLQVWEVKCQRVTMGISQDKTVYLDYQTLAFLENE
ncbi:MAG: hypothetical protein IJA45_00565 [Oscillospiraceae bacterium]|nr:hypothetical protein [Oscillospiraceae bacterium]